MLKPPPIGGNLTPLTAVPVISAVTLKPRPIPNNKYPFLVNYRYTTVVLPPAEAQNTSRID